MWYDISNTDGLLQYLILIFQLVNNKSGVYPNGWDKKEYIRGNLTVAPVTEKFCNSRLSWYGHIIRRNEENVVRKAFSRNVNGYKSVGRPKKRWLDCVNDNMVRKSLS